MQTSTQVQSQLNRLTVNVERIVNLNAVGVNTSNTKSGWPCMFTIVTNA